MPVHIRGKVAGLADFGGIGQLSNVYVTGPGRTSPFIGLTRGAHTPSIAVGPTLLFPTLSYTCALGSAKSTWFINRRTVEEAAANSFGGYLCQ